MATLQEEVFFVLRLISRAERLIREWMPIRSLEPRRIVDKLRSIGLGREYAPALTTLRRPSP